MTELEKIARAKMYIDKLANGIDPLNDQPVGEWDVVNQVRISRCFFYISEVLGKVLENGGVGAAYDAKPEVYPTQQPSKKQTRRRPPFALTMQQREAFYPTEKPIPLSELARWIAHFSGVEDMRPLPSRKIKGWLVSVGLLQMRENAQGKARAFVTPEGFRNGISIEERSCPGGSYHTVLYDAKMQQLIMDNLDAILSMEVRYVPGELSDDV